MRYGLFRSFISRFRPFNQLKMREETSQKGMIEDGNRRRRLNTDGSGKEEDVGYGEENRKANGKN